jgi:hypothetical protein
MEIVWQNMRTGAVVKTTFGKGTDLIFSIVDSQIA